MANARVGDITGVSSIKNIFDTLYRTGPERQGSTTSIEQAWTFLVMESMTTHMVDLVSVIAAAASARVNGSLLLEIHVCGRESHSASAYQRKLA